jgi:chromosome segregation ATPase
MASGGGGAPEPSSSGPVAAARRSRWLDQQYADITKLREIAARHDREAARAQQKISRINTRIEKLRHQATLLRERGERVLGEIPAFEQIMKQHERDIETAKHRHTGGTLSSDVTKLHYEIRKLQQKMVDRQQKARSLELQAAKKTQKTAELKVRTSRYIEAARVSEQEGASFRQRADRLQMVTEREATAPAADSAPTTSASEGTSRAP